jgi:acyl-CoA reductase-like NAD-dependent aldehyde dehydrogenase
VKEVQLYIGGRFQDSHSGRRFDSVNPFNGQVIAHVARADAGDIDLAVRSAREAFDKGPWPHLSPAERSGMLKAVSDSVNARKNELELLEVADSGSTIRKAKEDIYLSARFLAYCSKLALTDPVQPLDGVSKAGFSRNMLFREPVGVVAAITPWNFPLKMAVWKLGPALAAGNTVVLKPSELTPVTALELAAMFHEAGFPPGVVNILPGFGEDAGEELVKHPLVDKVSFTGSTMVGRRVMANAAATLKKCTLECGGKSANIVLNDADLSMAVDGAIYAMFYHQGQCCEAGSRLLLQEGIHDEFIERLVEKTRRLKLGDPLDSSTDIGPLISGNQRSKVLWYIQSGNDQGAQLLTGGKVPDSAGLKDGYFVEPTIFAGVDNSMTIAREEIFGPVLSILKFTNEDDAVGKANDSVYGLGGGVWSKDEEKALSLARRLRTGTVWINEWHLLSEKAPFGGYKQSGIGREFGLEGMYEYMEAKHVHVDEVRQREKKFWYDTVVPKS